MARIRLEIDDPALRLTLKTILEADGHALTGAECDLYIVDTPGQAVACAANAPTLLVCSASGLPVAIQAMRKGVFGYILAPLVPGEANLMVQRALGAPSATPQAVPAPTSLAQAERLHIEAVLRQCKHNQAEAARVLGIGRNTLWRKLKTYGAQ